MIATYAPRKVQVSAHKTEGYQSVYRNVVVLEYRPGTDIQHVDALSRNMVTPSNPGRLTLDCRELLYDCPVVSVSIGTIGSSLHKSRGKLSAQVTMLEIS